MLEEKLKSPLDVGIVVQFGVNLADLVDLTAEEAIEVVDATDISGVRLVNLPVGAPAELIVFLEMCRLSMPLDVDQADYPVGHFAKRIADFIYDEVYSQPLVSGLRSSPDQAMEEFRSLRLVKIAINEESGEIWPTFEYLERGNLADLPERETRPNRATPGELSATFSQAALDLGVEFPEKLLALYQSGEGTGVGILQPAATLLSLDTIINPNMPFRFLPFIDGNGGLDYGMYFPSDGRPPLIGLNVQTQFFTVITADLDRYWLDPARFDIEDEDEFAKRAAAEDKSGWLDLSLGGSGTPVDEFFKPIELNRGEYERLGSEIKYGAESVARKSLLSATHTKLIEHTADELTGMCAEVFPKPIDLLSAQAWSRLSENLEESGELDLAQTAAENAVAVGVIYPFNGFPSDTNEVKESPDYWDTLRKRRIPHFRRVIRLAEKRGDKIGLKTAKAQLVVLERWLEGF